MTYECPMCKMPLASVKGTCLNPNDGITLWCPNSKCPAQEVSGHGKNEAEAYNIIKEKYRYESQNR